MESWVILSLMTALLWATSDVINKFIFTRWPIKPVVLVIFSCLVNLVITFGVYVHQGLSELSVLHLLLAIAAAFFYFFGYYLYFSAVKMEEVSRITPLFYLMPLFILLLAAIFFQEKLTFIKYTGIILLVAGAILISQKGSFSFRIGKAFWFMILSALSISAYAIITKYLLNFSDYWTIFSYTRGLGLIPFLIPLIYKKLPDLEDAARQGGKAAIGMILGSASLNSIGIILITVAMAMGSVTLTNTMLSIQPLFVLIFAVFISRYYPQLFREDLDRRTVALKLVSILLIVAGAILIT
ncbi:MAG: DMT family transporter [Candidatus Paceibacterota bacterium]|jgi:drug/metabolite transporter (DMT)-like permease